jgi:hypothetical protein
MGFEPHNWVITSIMDGYNIHYGWFNHPKHIDGILRSLFFLDIGAFETSGFGCAMAKF